MFDFICDRDRVDIDDLNNIHFLKCGVFCYIFKHEIINKNFAKKKVEIFSSFLQKRKSRSLCMFLYVSICKNRSQFFFEKTQYVYNLFGAYPSKTLTTRCEFRSACVSPFVSSKLEGNR